MKIPAAFVGRWRITETEVWGRDALDMMVPAHVTFKASGRASFEMICVVGEMDCAFEEHRVEFSWAGNDEMDDASGRGWAEITRDGSLRGRIYFHHGDNSSFVARRRREERRGGEAFDGEAGTGPLSWRSVYATVPSRFARSDRARDL